MSVYQANQIDLEQNSDPTEWTELRGLTLEIPAIPPDTTITTEMRYDVVATLTVPRPYLRGKGYASGYFGLAIECAEASFAGNVEGVNYSGEIGYAISRASDNYAWPTCQPISITCHFNSWAGAKPLTIVPKWRLGLGDLMTVDSYRALIVSVDRAGTRDDIVVKENREIFVPPPVTVPFSFPIGGRKPGVYPPDFCGDPEHGSKDHECN